MKYLKIIIFPFILFYLPLSANSIWQELADYEPPEQKKFVFIICSCNNIKWYELNLSSAFSQDYPRDKFRFIYIDESRDGTADLVEAYVADHHESDRFILIRNDQWQSVMHNHYKAAHMCEDEEIIVHLDADDFLKHQQVLYLLNKVYNYWDIWLTYGQYEDWPNPYLGFSVEVPPHIAINNQFREMGFWYSHLRTCYAWLFKKIKLKDLIWKGSFIPTTPAVDYMFMFAMIEMAGNGHYKFIPDVLYSYNRSNSLSTCNMRIPLEIPPAKSWTKYQPLMQNDDHITQKRLSKRADLVILSFDDPQKLLSFANNELPKIHDIDNTVVLYHASTPENLAIYQAMQSPHGNIALFNHESADCNEHCFDSCANDYCLVITDAAIKVDNCSTSKWVYELERTGAQAFFLGLSKKSFKLCEEKINYGPFPDCQIGYRIAILGNGVAAWQFGYEEYIWDDPLLMIAVLMRKKDFAVGVQLLKQNFSIHTLKEILYDLMNGDREIGLFML